MVFAGINAQLIDKIVFACYNRKNKESEVDKMTYIILIKSSVILSAD